MASPKDDLATSTCLVVDLTLDSDDDSQTASNASPKDKPEVESVIKNEPGEEHQKDLDPINIVGPTDDKSDQPGSPMITDTAGTDKTLNDTHRSPSAEIAEIQNENQHVVEQDPSGNNTANEALPETEFDPLPEFDMHQDLGMDAAAIDALQQYNANKHELEGNNGDDVDDYLGETEIPSERIGVPIEDDQDNLNWDAELEQEAAEANEAAAAAFAQRKSAYELKRAEGTNTEEDDIRFATDENAELSRLRDIERSQMEVEDTAEQTELPPGYVEEESLFVPEIPVTPEPRPKKTAISKPHSPRGNSHLQEALHAGIEDGPGQSRKIKRKARASSEVDSPPKRRRGNNKSAGVKKPTQKRGRKPGPSTSTLNIESLGRTNIIGPAQANASRPDMPTFTSKVKAKALNELIASIPTADRASAANDKAAVLQATKKFKGQGAMKSDGRGGWLLRGMTSSLYCHQVLGAAFLRERETGNARPKGGLICDEMGFGKTIQMIANILDGRPAPTARRKTTLIVAPPSLLDQWMQELDKHVKPGALGRILRYHSGSRLYSNDIVRDLEAYDVILTTYGEVQKSYPMTEIPKHLASEEKKQKWWEDYYAKHVGHLHQIRFLRVVLDEAHHIKNYLSKTSIAIRALRGEFKWCITGTPILNYIEELFPYLNFLQVPHTGDYRTFCHNYCNNRKRKDPVHLGRIHNILRAIMLRRTHEDTLFGAPIVKLPGISHRTVMVEFNPVERKIYNMVKSRYIEQINTFSKTNSLESNYSNILGMLIRLRMLCSHIMLCQDVLKRMFNAADIESLWRLTAREVQAPDEPANGPNMVTTLRRMLANHENTLVTNQTKAGESAPEMPLDLVNEEEIDTGSSSFGLFFKFRKFLRYLSQSKAWTELHIRSRCAKCRMPPDEPVCTSCFHVYCQECMNALHIESRARDEEKTACLECQTTFEETTDCDGLKELGFNGPEIRAKVERRKKKLAQQQEKAKKAAMRKRGASARRSSVADDTDEEDDEEEIDWIAQGGGMLPSAKLAATKAAILNWRKVHPNQKIIIYTQFLGLGRILGQICEAEEWGYINFNGKMTIEARGRAIEKFRDDPSVFIMICSLKAGGVGLNLTMASKVIILDLWFNTSIEAQAYCRAFRIGQEQKVDVLRFAVKDSIDEDLINMQERKDEEVSAVIGSAGLKKRATIRQLLELFGDVEEGEHNEFILVEDDAENEEIDWDQVGRVPPRPF